MKTNKGLPNRYIGDNNVGYNTKMEVYTTSMSDMNELSEIGGVWLMEREKKNKEAVFMEGTKYQVQIMRG